MKISEDYIVREIAGEYVVVPTGPAAVRFNGLITINEVGAFLWRRLQAGADEAQLLQAVLEEYEVEKSAAQADLAKFLQTLRQNHILEQ